MRRSLKVILQVASFSLASAAVAQGQVFTPTYQSPRMVNEFGVALSDGPGSLAIEGIWRGGPLGVRVGFADTEGGGLMVGGELRNPLPIADAPLGLAFTAAGQALLGDEDALGAHAGVSAGYTFMAPGLAVTPYLHPRVGMIRSFGETNLRLRALAGIGADIEFYNNLLLHVGVALDEVGTDWGITFAIRR